MNNEKEELLDSIDKIEKNISLKELFVVFLLVFISLLIFLPKVYFANQIYYISRDISDLKGKLSVLEEENNLLRSKIQMMNYKQQILTIVPDSK